MLCERENLIYSYGGRTECVCHSKLTCKLRDDATMASIPRVPEAIGRSHVGVRYRWCRKRETPRLMWPSGHRLFFWWRGCSAAITRRQSGCVVDGHGAAVLVRWDGWISYTFRRDWRGFGRTFYWKTEISLNRRENTDIHTHVVSKRRGSNGENHIRKISTNNRKSERDAGWGTLTATALCAKHNVTILVASYTTDRS